MGVDLPWGSSAIGIDRLLTDVLSPPTPASTIDRSHTFSNHSQTVLSLPQTDITPKRVYLLSGLNTTYSSANDSLAGVLFYQEQR